MYDVLNFGTHSGLMMTVSFNQGALLSTLLWLIFQKQ
jgi:hypothetical protein